MNDNNVVYNSKIDPDIAKHLERFSYLKAEITISGSARILNHVNHETPKSTGKFESLQSTYVGHDTFAIPTAAVKTWTCAILIIILSTYLVLVYYNQKLSKPVKTQEINKEHESETNRRHNRSDTDTDCLDVQKINSTNLKKSSRQQLSPHRVPVRCAPRRLFQQSSSEIPDLINEDQQIVIPKTSGQRSQNVIIEIPSIDRPDTSDIICSLKDTITGLTNSAQKQGLHIKPDHLHGMAVQMELSQLQERQKLLRQCVSMKYDSNQRYIDREIQAEQHQSVIAAQRERHDWLAQLIMHRDNCIGVLYTSAFICAICCISILTLDWLCSLSRAFRTLLQPSVQTVSNSKYGIGWSWSQQILPTFVPAWSTISDGIYMVLNALALLLVLWFIQQIFKAIALPHFLETTIKTLVVFVVVVVYDLAPRRLLVSLGSLLFIISVGASALVYRKFYQYKVLLKKEKTPSAAKINDCIDWFDTGAGAIRCAYLGCFLFWVGLLYFTGDLNMIMTRVRDKGQH